MNDSPQKSGGLTWGLLIATYRREEILPRCLRLAVEQSRPPSEVVVVDSSPGWQATRDKVFAEIKPLLPNARWVYVEAERRSSAAQRNQAVSLGTADIAFLIDDDSLMYPDCAAKVMEIYEADPERRVAGVNAVHTPQPPDDPSAPLGPGATVRRYSPVAKLVRKLLSADDIFVPYDADFPRHELPGALVGRRIGNRPLMAGWGMTFRRDICVKEPFEVALTHYASGEDSDMGYRASRHGLLLTAFDARLCHVGSSGGRLPMYVVTAFGGLNPLVLHRLHSTDLERSKHRNRAMLVRRALIGLAKDLSRSDWSVPRARGMLLALGRMNDIFRRSPEELRAWYPTFQKQLIDENVRA